MKRKPKRKVEILTPDGIVIRLESIKAAATLFGVSCSSIDYSYWVGKREIRTRPGYIIRHIAGDMPDGLKRKCKTKIADMLNRYADTKSLSWLAAELGVSTEEIQAVYDEIYTDESATEYIMRNQNTMSVRDIAAALSITTAEVREIYDANYKEWAMRCENE